MKNLFTIAFILSTTVALAQSAKRTSAIMAYNDATSYLMKGDSAKALKALNEAVTYIDLAQAHEKTSSDAKTLFYMGEIFLLKCDLELGSGDKNAAFVSGSKALEGYQRCLKIEHKNNYKESIVQKLLLFENTTLNVGVGFFNEKKYQKAVETFKMCTEIAHLAGVVDTIAIYNTGLSAERGEDLSTALEYYQKTADLNYQSQKMYLFMINILKSQGKQEARFAKIKAARARFPADKDLIIEEVNYYLSNENFEEAEKNLELAISKDLGNKVLHFSVGTVYDNLKKYDKAKAAYKKALELDSEYFDASFNLGALYFNQAVEMNNNLDPEMSTEAYDKAKEKIDAIFQDALGPLEKAHSLRSKDPDTLRSLIQLYGRLNMTDEYNETKAKAEALANG